MVMSDRNRLLVRRTDLLTLLRSEGSAGWFAWEGGRRFISTRQRSD